MTREALAEQPAQRCKYGNEPVSCTSSPMDCQCAIDAVLVPLYASPQPSKPWVGLTDEDDVVEMARDSFACRFTALPVHSNRIKSFAEAIEAKLREKNA